MKELGNRHGRGVVLTKYKLGEDPDKAKEVNDVDHSNKNMDRMMELMLL